MPYSKTVWVDVQNPAVPPAGAVPIDATRLNKLETGVETAQATAEAAVVKPAAPANNTALLWNGTGWVAARLANDQIASDAAIAVSKLAPGAANQVLTTVGGIPVWAASGETQAAALSAELGVNPSGVFPTVAERLDDIQDPSAVFTVTNIVQDFSLNGSTYTLAEMRNLVGTLIQALQARGIIG